MATEDFRGISVRNHVIKPKATSFTQTTPEAKTTFFPIGSTQSPSAYKSFLSFIYVRVSWNLADMEKREMAKNSKERWLKTRR
jgi:hypothetical protein